MTPSIVEARRHTGLSSAWIYDVIVVAAYETKNEECVSTACPSSESPQYYLTAYGDPPAGRQRPVSRLHFATAFRVRKGDNIQTRLDMYAPY